MEQQYSPLYGQLNSQTLTTMSEVFNVTNSTSPMAFSNWLMVSDLAAAMQKTHGIQGACRNSTPPETHG